MSSRIRPEHSRPLYSTFAQFRLESNHEEKKTRIGDFETFGNPCFLQIGWSNSPFIPI